MNENNVYFTNENNVYFTNDIHGNEIRVGNTVLYEGKTYVVMYNEKDGSGWTLHPCNNNQNGTVQLPNVAMLSDTMTLDIEVIR